MPQMSFTVSVAMTEPTDAQSAPSTPPVAQSATDPGDGATGKRSRYVGPWGAQKTATWPSNPRIDPQTSGLPSRAQASSTR